MPKYTVTLTVDATSAAEALAWVAFDGSGDMNSWWETATVEPASEKRGRRLIEVNNEEEN